jgi:hypothetical protein
MSVNNIFTLDSVEDFSEQLNLDELYETKKQKDLVQLEWFNKMLNRVHARIKYVSRSNERMCWFTIPEFILGVPRYDQAACIAYILDKLQTNGFVVRYVHPNTLIISWAHIVPTYVRTELKRKMGIDVDMYGQPIPSKDSGESNGDGSHGHGESSDMDRGNRSRGKRVTYASDTKRNYTPIQSYQPTGKLVYRPDVMQQLESKLESKYDSFYK